jgi:diguanylate cyclase (GGDEF)-like protein/PAS domain S-box-containing protein
MILIKSVAAPLPPLRPSDVGQTVYERFRAEPTTVVLAVVDEDELPVGLIERNSFSIRMASEYGRALYAQRPISLLMDDRPLLVDGERAMADFTALAINDRAGDLMRGFIVTRASRYFGVGTALSLLEAANNENLRTTAELYSLAESLTEAKAAAERDKLFTDTIVENIPAVLMVKDVEENRFVLVNRAAEKAVGIPRKDLIGRRVHDVFDPQEADIFAAQDQAVLASGEELLVQEAPLHRPDGSVVILRTKKLAVADETGDARYLLVVSEDITERKRDEARIERLAHYDSLTDLANRVMFHRELDQRLKLAGRLDEAAAVICIDLDHFKTVNDTLGHAAGDLLLRSFADRLRACVRSGDVVARLGGDEFAILQTGARDRQESAALAKRVVEAATAPFELNGREVSIGASVGVAFFPADGIEGGDLLKKADMALYCVKSEGRCGHRFFEGAMNGRLQARRALELDLRRALTHGEFELYYQPLFDLAGAEISGCEALLRWNHPKRGLIAPNDFIPLAEEIGLIGPLGEWVLNTACREAVHWPADLKLAVNISPVQFRSRTLVQAVAAALSASGLAAERLELEITESVLLGDDASNLRTLHRLRGLGCRISLDDFGTGYSSLSYLRSFPFDKIKIDRCFVRDLPNDRDSLAIIKAVTGLSASLGMTTTAEGVETEEQLAQLRAQGCTEIQGFLIGRPYPVGELRGVLAAETKAGNRAA